MATPSTSPRLTVEEIGDVAVVHFVDSKILDELNVQKIGDELFALVEDHGHRKLLLNFSTVQKMTTAVIAKLMILHKKAATMEGKLVMCGFHPDFLQVFKIAKLDTILTITADQNSGLRAF